MLQNTFTRLFLIAASIGLFISCFKDSGTKTFKIYTPIYQTTQQVRASVKNDAPKPINSVGKMVLLGNYIYLNEPQKGIHIIDNSNPEKPINKAFINIPGNENLAIKGNFLYADCFTDLMAIDISNANNITPKSFINNLFPDRRYINGYIVDSGKIIIDWQVRDTTINIDIAEGQGIWRNGSYITSNISWMSSSFLSASGASSGKGIGVTGSTSKYAIVDNYLYALTSSELKTINIAQPDAPKAATTTTVTWGLETVFPFKNNLFLGTQTGMYIYGLSNPEKPNQLSLFVHARLCDPVIADDKYAYVTLHSNNNPSTGAFTCFGNLNQLDIIDIADVTKSKWLKSYNLTRPYGLSKDGNLLFICDSEAGLKIFDATDPLNLKQTKTMAIGTTSDVIALDGIAYVTTSEGLYQFSYKNSNNITLLSKISLTN
ncbi:MAG: hypothetical protein QM541_13850 [Flavobacterium sp.]|nr:hypothetical protein [Flavobacterium sp.]